MLCHGSTRICLKPNRLLSAKSTLARFYEAIFFPPLPHRHRFLPMSAAAFDSLPFLSNFRRFCKGGSEIADPGRRESEALSLNSGSNLCSSHEILLLLWIRHSLRFIFRSGGSPTHKLAKILSKPAKTFTVILQLPSSTAAVSCMLRPWEHKILTAAAAFPRRIFLLFERLKYLQIASVWNL